jgi:hypothetical protein
VYLESGVVNEQNAPFLIRLYFFTQSRFAKTLALARACFIGLWLGVLTRASLHAIDEEYYTRTKRGIPGEYNFHSTAYNQRGLWDWEEEMLNDYFADCRRLLVIGAGGGREVLALQRLGYQVDGFESHPDLVATANELLRVEGYDPTVRLVPRDQGSITGTIYDGIIIGWGAYMLVNGRKHRIALLRQMRAQTRVQCPILLSFFSRDRTPRIYRISVLVANTIRRALRQELVEVGDWLVPNYVHYFSQDEIVSELSEGGFATVHYNTTGYGHAVGVAV